MAELLDLEERVAALGARGGRRAVLTASGGTCAGWTMQTSNADTCRTLWNFGPDNGACAVRSVRIGRGMLGHTHKLASLS